MIVVSDTSPIYYLILIEQISLLPRLYGHVVIPDVVRDELGDCRSPLPVRQWMDHLLDWLTVQSVDRSPDLELPMLDPGERAAVLLVERLQADVLLIDIESEDRPRDRAKSLSLGHWAFWKKQAG